MPEKAKIKEKQGRLIMPKQVYVYPGNINDADTIEGMKTVLEPAVDAVYAFDDSSKKYVKTSDTAVELDTDVYLFTDSKITSAYARHTLLHYAEDAPKDANNRPFIPLVLGAASTNSNYLRFGIIKVDESATNGYSIVATSNQYAYTKHYWHPVKIKVLWDDTSATYFVAISDVPGRDSSSSSNSTNMTRAAAVLLKYDKAGDSISVVQSVNNSSILRKVPVSGVYFYYDSNADSYTFYQMLLGPGGSLEIRKTTVTQTSVTDVLEPVTLAGASVSAQYPDNLSDPYYFFQEMGMLEKRPWLELTNPLESVGTDFTIMLLNGANIGDSSAYVAASDTVLHFERGQYSYDSGNGSWTFTVSAEFSVDSLTKQFLEFNVQFKNGVKGLVPAHHPDRPSSSYYSYDDISRVQFISYDNAASITDLEYEVLARTQGYAQTTTSFGHIARYKGTFTSAGTSLITSWMPLAYIPEQGDVGFQDFQIDTADLPPILLYSNGYNIIPAIKATSQALITAIAPVSGKYIYDLSTSSVKGNKYYIFMRIWSSRSYPYVMQANHFAGASRAFIVANDGVRSVPGIMAASQRSVSSTSAFNYSAGGTITNVYKRDASGLENLAVWVRSGSTMHAIFSFGFERNLDTESILKYIHDNTDVDAIFVHKDASFNSSDTKLFMPLAQFFQADEGDTSSDYQNPVPSVGRIRMRTGGSNATNYGYRGVYVYYNKETNSLLEIDAEDANTLVLTSLLLINRPTYISGQESRHAKRLFVSADGALSSLYNNYYFQLFRDYWTADYEDTIEITIGTAVYKYVVIGKYSLDGATRLVAVLEDIV